MPAIPGLAGLKYHVLRTLADALALRAALPRVKRAVVLGGGLIGMHAAENLAKGGVAVSVVELQPHVLSGYFDAEASAIIESVFAAKGVRLLTGASVASVAAQGAGCRATLANGTVLDADLLLVATGVAPVTDFLEGSGVATERGVLVDEHMRTNVANIWAAGDVAQARGFFTRRADHQRHPARRRRPGTHRRHGDGRGSGIEDLCRRRAAQHLQLLRPAGGLGRGA